MSKEPGANLFFAMLKSKARDDISSIPLLSSSSLDAVLLLSADIDLKATNAVNTKQIWSSSGGKSSCWLDTCFESYLNLYAFAVTVNFPKKSDKSIVILE